MMNLFAISGEKWVDEALCAQVGGDLFFVDKGETTGPAKAICALCPVRQECLQHALDHNEHWGVWGGMSERERHRLKRPVRPGTPVRDRTPIPLSAGLAHGTRGGYNAGCKCRPCCAADGWYQKQRHKERGNYGGAA